MQVVVKPKVFFSSFFLQKAAKSSSLSHVSFFGVDDENKVDQSLMFSSSSSSILGTSYFAGHNDQLRLKSSKEVLKAFQLILSWLKMK